MMNLILGYGSALAVGFAVGSEYSTISGVAVGYAVSVLVDIRYQLGRLNEQ